MNITEELQHPFPLTAFVRGEHGSCTIVLQGELDSTSVGLLHDLLATLLANGQTHVNLDMSDVPFMDSSGLGALIKGYLAAQQRAGEVRVCNPSRPVRRLLEITGQAERLIAESVTS